MTSHLTSIIYILYRVYKLVKYIIVCRYYILHITMTITLLVTQTHNANIPLFPGLSAHHSLPEIVSLVDVEGVEHLNGKRKYDGGVLLS